MKEPLDQITKVKGDKKVMNAWAFYDWANSVYPLVITTAIFPLFFAGVTRSLGFVEYVNGEEVIYVYFMGLKLVNTFLITLISAVYFLLIVLVMPILTGIADYKGNKKSFLRFFCYLGSFSCMGLGLFDVNHLELSMIPFFTAGIGFWSSLVYYNAYLPEIAEEKDHDWLSAKGFSLGYFGSMLLLAICLVLVLSAADGQGALMSKICFVLTGIWWFGFAHVTFNKMPVTEAKVLAEGESIFSKGFGEIRSVMKQVKKTVRLKRYITAFFVYSMAVQTIMLMAVYFGEKEVDWGTTDSTMGLIISVLLIQLIAIPGAYGLSWVSSKIGNIKALGIVILMWIALCVSAYIVTKPVHFYIIAAFVGLVMGGVQSLSRSTFSKFIPTGTKDTASFFSFYDISEKMGIVIGMLSYGLIEQLTGTMRNSIVSLVIFFAVGFLLLLRIPKDEVLLSDSETID
ncbi:MAG: UMF1 family MFS transporter [Flavobacteriales bacterium]|jgi:UMF1 family MFS transporter